tara:strand:+ start:21903 stop:22718 length:816 start_codon:yes stop_codon:yes gene_type:complete
MKKNYLLFTLSFALSAFIVTDAFTNSSGAPSGNSGGPNGNNNTCARAGCHNGPSASSQTISITTTIPATGFKEDSVYQISIMADNGGTGTNEMGFSASVESAAGFEGNIVITDPTDTKKIGSYITHTSAGRNGATGGNMWAFDWDAGQAPDQTTVYVAVNFSDNTGSTNGDVIVTNNLVLNKAASGIGIDERATVALSIYPNPVQDLFVLSANSNLEAPFKVMDLSGKLVLNLGEGERMEQNHFRFDVSELAKGTYILSDSQGFSAQLLKD